MRTPVELVGEQALDRIAAVLAGDTIRDAGRAPREAKSGYRENTISGVSARNNHYL